MISAPPPSCTESETALLGGLLLDPERIDEIAGEVSAIDFYDMRHGNLFEHLLSLRDGGAPIDIVSVTETIGDIETIGGVSYVSQLPDKCPTSSHVPYYASILRKKKCLRDFQRVSYNIHNILNSKNSDEEALEELARVTQDVLGEEGGQGSEVTAREAVQKAIDEIEAAFQCDGNCVGVPSGFSSLDRGLGGLHDGEMVVLAARPSMGKTSMAMNIVEHVAIDNQIPVGVFSLEMTATSLMKRSMAGRGRVDSVKLRDGNLIEPEFKSLISAAGKISASPITIIEKPFLDIHEFRSLARRMKSVHGVRLIVLDYLQLMHAKAESRVQEVTRCSNAVKGVAKELGVPILCLSQLSRSAEQQDRAPRLSDLRDSGAVEQDADVVAFLYQPNKESGMVEVHVCKNRNGPVGAFELEFIAKHSRFQTPLYGADK